ncbi:MAG: Holliday junction branch migration protein RuvA [Clostridiales bacterium]|nr:Holliday junction branch migration protein RuvA [Clostridiales bacterium]
MIAQLTGNVVSTTNNSAVIDVNGIGFLVTCSHNTLADISGKGGEKTKIYTHMVVREDAMELYGFSRQDELSAFGMLISVSGVGAKSAIAVLSTLSPEKFALAVTTEDSKAISRAPGVGARTAARIILELKDKIAKEFGGDVPARAESPEQVSGDSVLSDAINTLIVLGYTRAEATSALAGLGGLGLEDMIKAALKKLSVMG